MSASDLNGFVRLIPFPGKHCCTWRLSLAWGQWHGILRMGRKRFQHFLASLPHPSHPPWSGTVLLRGLGEYKNKRGPNWRALISRFLVHYLRLFLTQGFFFALFTWLLSASSHIFNLTSRQCSHFNGFFLQEAIKDFRVNPTPPFF